MIYRRGWIVLLVLAILTPLGIIAAGGAWGEWDLDGVRARVGFAPDGMRESTAGGADRPLQEYTVPGLDKGFFHEGLGTILSALLGAGFTALIAFALARTVKGGGIH
ncbi:MAG: cobalamin biosynthesis protein [Candidatus Krumholzibacteria bacterium]|nr:cobalamin biosynthesis protein [Candidatus Krumholzibacteria bacterium]